MTLIYLCAVLFGVAMAQRPPSSSICDYYTLVKYGSASEANQLKMMQGIVALAFGGPTAGSIKADSVPDGLTGILNPGVHDGVPVNLLPFFNGSIASTNLNNLAVGINWLDDGGKTPLVDFMSNKTDTVVLSPASNEYRLFGHFYTAFGKIFGCSNPPPSPTAGGPPNPAYVHKFMDLNFTEIGHFINQLTLSAEFHGFSTQDAQSLELLMNGRYNTRCAPAMSVDALQPPQLFSICQNPTCPLAVPNSDCEAYHNITADGVSSSPSDPSNPATVTDSEPSSGSKGLSGGGIAGVVIGAVALIAFIIAAIFYLRRKRRPKTPPAPPQPETQWAGNSESFIGSPGQGFLSPQSEHFSAHSPNNRDSYVSNAHTSYSPRPVEIGTPKLPEHQEEPVELSGDRETAVELSGETMPEAAAEEFRKSRGVN